MDQATGNVYVPIMFRHIVAQFQAQAAALLTAPARLGLVRRRALQRLGDPVPCPRLVMYRPYELRTRRIRKFGKDADQLTVKLFRPVLVVLRSVRDECYQGGVPTNQPRRDVPVVVKAHRSDVPGPDEFGPIVLSHPHVRRIHACLPLPLSHACSQLTPAVGRLPATRFYLRRPRSRRIAQAAYQPVHLPPPVVHPQSRPDPPPKPLPAQPRPPPL